ncbi:unnamed protein product [Cylicocyclus nassatus]|uniref:Uncharacterized protein n=1 Tax=Cylicocyclus nassatus TaxID=53992 RepID=A0AA36DM34_CYLNA|nr:unnamed protein product [Cylicocyclus nassatus]
MRQFYILLVVLTAVSSYNQLAEYKCKSKLYAQGEIKLSLFNFRMRKLLQKYLGKLEYTCNMAELAMIYLMQGSTMDSDRMPALVLTVQTGMKQTTPTSLADLVVNENRKIIIQERKRLLRMRYFGCGFLRKTYTAQVLCFFTTHNPNSNNF